MGELYNPFPKLPKNIRQIGERDEVAKLYMEDYVSTYLKRLYPQNGQDMRVGLLLGTMEINDGTPYLFIDGAMEMEDVAEAGGKVMFSELAWKKAYQNMEQLFPRREIQGWFLCGAPGCDLTPLNYWKQHIRYFQGTGKMMYLNCGAEGDESVYITSEDGFYKLKGYNIYYERNQMMQDYMVLRKDVRRIEAGDDDKVIREFRKRMDEHKDFKEDRRQTAGLMRGLTAAMSVVILAGGIVMFNNYQKMKEMESVIASALPEKAEKILMGKNDSAENGGKESKVIIEEVEAGLEPSTASRKTAAETETATEATQESGQAGRQESIGTDAEGSIQAGVQAGTQGSTQGSTQADTRDSVRTDTAETSGAADKEPALTKPVSIPAGARIHVIEDGETLYGICLSEYHDINRLKEICEINGLEDQDKIVSGQELILP